MLALGLQHWEAPHPAWSSSAPWGGGAARQEARGAARPALFRHPGATALSLAGRGPGSGLPQRAGSLKRETRPKEQTRAS